MKSKIICFIGETATGKSSIVQKIIEKYSFDKNNHQILNKVVSHTTRPKRPGENDGGLNGDYVFVSDEEFDNILKTEKVLEKTEYLVNEKRFRYSLCANAIRDDIDNIVIINPHGLVQLLKYEDLRKRLVIVYCKTDLGIRIGRYLTRENVDDSAYKRLIDRLIQDKKDFANFEQICLDNHLTTYIVNNSSNVSLDKIAQKIKNKIIK